jgi:hypothetical protein
MNMFHCVECGDDIPQGRSELGYRLCLFCGEEASIVERKSWCVVQEYGKGNYQFVTKSSATRILKETNQKGVRT